MPIVKIFKRGVQDDELTRDHPHERARARTRDGRFPRADRRRSAPAKQRYGALLQQVRPRRRSTRASRRVRATERDARAIASRDSRRHVRSRIVHGRRRHHRHADSDQGRVIVAGDEMTIDLSDVGPQVQGYFNSRRDGRPVGGAGRVQVRHHADAVSDQRRLVPSARHHLAARPRRQRDEARRDALVDDDSDDGRRHDLQARSRRPFPSASSPATTRTVRGHDVGINPRTGRSLRVGDRPAGRRLGRQARQRRHERGRVHQRRRHAQRRDRSARSQDSGHHRTLRAAARFGRRRVAIAAASASRCACARRRRCASTCTPNARSARRGDSPAAATRCRTACTSNAPTAPTFRSGNGKLEGKPLAAADVMVIESGGGGGYGDPHDRPRDVVAADVRNGYVSARQRARHLRTDGERSMTTGASSARPAALVTGAASGIGRAAAVALAAAGFDVAINYSRSENGARKTAAAAPRRRARRRWSCAATSATMRRCARCSPQWSARFGRLDALVNNAGTTSNVGPEGFRGDDCRGMGPRLRRQRARGLPSDARRRADAERSAGSVVNTASIVGLRPGPQPLPYAASKAAVVSLTKLLALNLGPDIRVNAVAPGWMEGDWMERMLGDRYDDLMARRAKITPLKRVRHGRRRRRNDRKSDR